MEEIEILKIDIEGTSTFKKMKIPKEDINYLTTEKFKGYSETIFIYSVFINMACYTISKKEHTRLSTELKIKEEN